MEQHERRSTVPNSIAAWVGREKHFKAVIALTYYDITTRSTRIIKSSQGWADPCRLPADPVQLNGEVKITHRWRTVGGRNGPTDPDLYTPSSDAGRQNSGCYLRFYTLVTVSDLAWAGRCFTDLVLAISSFRAVAACPRLRKPLVALSGAACSIAEHTSAVMPDVVHTDAKRTRGRSERQVTPKRTSRGDVRHNPRGSAMPSRSNNGADAFLYSVFLNPRASLLASAAKHITSPT